MNIRYLTEPREAISPCMESRFNIPREVSEVCDIKLCLVSRGLSESESWERDIFCNRPETLCVLRKSSTLSLMGGKNETKKNRMMDIASCFSSMLY